MHIILYRSNFVKYFLTTFFLLSIHSSFPLVIRYLCRKVRDLTNERSGSRLDERILLSSATQVKPRSRSNRLLFIKICRSHSSHKRL